jgi:hypothetical protein
MFPTLSRRRGARPAAFRPCLEALDGRIVPALSFTPTTSGSTLVQTLVGGGITFSNVNLVSGNASAGTFTGGNGIIGFESGVVLASGDITSFVGPNNSDSSTVGGASGMGDPDLDTIVPPNQSTTDATILEFDFVPTGTELSFNYVFASDEYNEFVGSGFNDVFAFFLNGTNVALLPGTTTAVSINTVNMMSNSQFYINNDLSDGGGSIDTELDGLTTVLTVNAQVNPGVVNHIKLAISDVGDQSLDSAVFIQAGSFSAPLAPVLRAFHPFRYAFRAFLDQQDGNITLLNVGNADATGRIRITLKNLPSGVELLNASGFNNKGEPVIVVQVSNLSPGVPLRVPVQFSNPFNVHLSTFFIGYDIEVAGKGA